MDKSRQSPGSLLHQGHVTNQCQEGLRRALTRRIPCSQIIEEVIAVSAQSERERTILISSHLVSEFESLIEHIVILDPGPS